MDADAIDRDELEESLWERLKREGIERGWLSPGSVEMLQTSMGLVENRIGG
jgi:hypothetical protein